MKKCNYCGNEMNENPHRGFCGEYRGRLGEDAHKVILGALDGKAFLYTGMKDERLDTLNFFREFK